MTSSPLPALATADDLAERLKVEPPTGETLVQWEDALLDASNDLRRIIGQPLTPATVTIALKIQANGFALLPFCPVVDVTAIVDNYGNSLPTDGTGFEVDGQRLTIFPGYVRAHRQSRLLEPTYTVTVEHGWDPIPGDIVKWVCVLAAAQIAGAPRGSLGLPTGVTSVAVDDGRVNYDSAATGIIPDKIQAELRACYGGEQL